MDDNDRNMSPTLRAANEKGGRGYSRKAEKTRMATDRVGELGRLILLCLGVGLAVLLLDGFRRDYGNLSAVLVAHGGSVTIAIPGDGKQVELPPNDGTGLDVGASITTGPGSFATLAFPDGSSIRIEASSSLTIRMLDYFRSGRRDRAFSLAGGSAFVRHSANAGPLSLLSVDTGGSLAVGKAGSAWRVSNSSGVARIEAVGGSAVLKTASGRHEVRTGQQVDSDGKTSTFPGTQPLRQLSSALTRYEVKPNFWTKAVAGATRFLDPLLQRIGVTAQGWNPDKTDFTRRMATLASLKKLATLFRTNDAPETLNPVSLTELSDGEETDRLKKDFAGMAIDSYQKQGTGYVLRVRARDSIGTPFEMTNGKIREGR